MLHRGVPVTCALLCLAGFAGPAVGSPAGKTLFGRPVHEAPALGTKAIEERRREFETMLKARGWETHGDIIGPPELFAGGSGTEAPADWDYPPHRATIFLNFFGGDLSNGGNSALMESTCINGSFKYPGFGGTEAQALAIIETFKSQLAPYGVRLAYDEAPPPELPYAMVMMGGTPQMIGMSAGILGVSCSSDCGDRWWRDTTLAFTDAASQSQINTLATTALHEAAHAFGLAHIDTALNSGYIMHPYVDNKERSWADGCIKYNDATGGINCKATHDIFCGGGAQNDVAELMAYFGPNSPDLEAPTVEILMPADGAELAEGAAVSIQAEVTDNHDGAGWKIMIYKEGVLVEESPAFWFEESWQLAGLSAGTYVVRVQAIDHDRNIGADEVTLYVGTAAPESTGGSTGSESSGDDGAPTSGSPDETTGTSTSPLTAGETPNDDSDGCSCISGERPVSGLWLLAGLAGLLGRRRRFATAIH
jgi:MYXO-CTERM domain-containing protein